MVLLDSSQVSVRFEWAIIEAHCNPAFVLLNNVNLPDDQGWIRNHLLLSGNWSEIYLGAWEDSWAVPLRHLVGIYSKRQYSVLMRVK